MRIHTYPDSVLRQKSKPVEKVTPQIRQILKEMSEAMYLAGGIGLAAAQVGINKQLIIMDIGEGLKCFVNPRIVERKGASVLEEGCLSFPGVTVRVKRAAEVLVEALDENGKAVSLIGEDLMAHVLQHEIDHLQGKLIIDYASWRDKFKLRHKLKEFAIRHPASEEIKRSIDTKCL